MEDENTQVNFVKKSRKLFLKLIRFIVQTSLMKETEMVYFTKNLGVPRVIYTTVPIEYPITSFDKVTNFILYAAEACQRLRVNEETSRKSRLRWYSALADIYNGYKELVEQTIKFFGLSLPRNFFFVRR